ncbi:MAG TPA: hypothetical protein VG076_07335 [Acidimicrobiales bacterium]|nr:hypothetical protein [Acidimicrobiales bacterium]
MHICAECGKKMATAGGLEIHAEIAHKASAPAAALAGAQAATAVPAHLDIVPVVRPRRTGTSNRAAVPVIALAIVALLVAGVASALVRRTEGPSTPLAMVEAAATSTAHAGTAHVVATVKSASGPLANGLTVDSAFDFDSRRATMNVDASKFGAPEIGTIQAVVDYANGFVMYMKFPPQLSSELGGKAWVKFDVGSLLKQSGVNVDLSALTQGQSADPTSGLALLRGADSVVTVGTEAIRGTETTHYKLVVNLDKAIADAPQSQRDALSKLAAIYTIHTFPLDVWLDREGRVRRFQQTIDPLSVHKPPGDSAGTNPITSPLTTTVEMYDFGHPVDVQIPPADQTTDLSQLLKNAGN